MTVMDYTEQNKAEYFNKIYEEKGFDGVIEEVEYMLELGSVIEKEDGMYCITTAGWSDDEELCGSLIHFMSMFGYKHYVGVIRGGAYYFCKDTDKKSFEIIPKK